MTPLNNTQLVRYSICWFGHTGSVMLPVFGALHHKQSTLSISPPFRKQHSVTLLTSAAISHLDNRVIQLALLTLLACIPLFFWLIDANPLTLHNSNFLWAAGLGILTEVPSNRANSELARTIPKGVFIVLY